MKKMIIAAAFALVAAPAFANMANKVVIDQPPPPPYAEEGTAHQKEGFVWAPGYWAYNGSKHEWKKGHFVAERKGYKYVSPRWAEENGKWTLYPEQWVKNEDDKEKTVSKDS